MVGQRRNTCFVIFRIDHFQKNKGREGKLKLVFNTFQENTDLKLTVQRGENFNSLILISESLMTLLKGVYYRNNPKIHQEFQHLFKPDLILVTDILTRVLAQHHLE